MKFLLPLLLLFTVHSQAQINATLAQDDPSSSMTEWRKSKPQATEFLTLQGGLIFDLLRGEDYLGNKNDFYNKDYIGLNYFNFDFGRQLEKEMQGIAFDFLWFNGALPLKPPIGLEGYYYYTEVYYRTKLAIDLSFYRVFKITNGDRFNIFVGPLVALGIANETRIPYITTRFSISNQDLRLGLGAKVNVQIKLSENLFLSTGTKGLLADLIYHRDSIENPNIPIRNQRRNATFLFKFLRPQIYIPFGLTFMFAN